MKVITLLIVLLLEAVSIISQDNGSEVKLFKHVVHLKGFEYRYTTFKNINNGMQGLKIGKSYIQCSAGIEDSLFFIELGNPDDQRRYIYSVLGSSNKIFNQTREGRKIGIWINKDIADNIVDMYFYNNNNDLDYKIYFQKNGYIKKIIGYKNGEIVRYSDWNFDSNGRRIGKRASF